MKKKIIIMLLIMVIAAGSAFAFDPLKAADGISDNSFFINFGLFINPNVDSTYISFPPFGISFDFLLPIGIPLSVGASFNMVTLESTSDYYRNMGFAVVQYSRTETLTGMFFGARAAWHFDFGVRNLDVYALAELGLLVETWEAEYSRFYNSESEEYSEVFFGIFAGIRYFFTNNFGIFAELGFSMPRIASFGIAFKF